MENMPTLEPLTERRYPLTQGVSSPTRRGRGLPWSIARVLRAFSAGRLEVVDGPTRHTFGDPGANALAARVEIHDPRTWRALLLGGTIGTAEAYAEGWWSADDLTALIRLVARNERAAAGLDGWLSWAALAVHTALHRLRGNRRGQSRRNISAHYQPGAVSSPGRSCTLRERVAIPHYLRESVVAAPSGAVFDWHARPGALERLTPPWRPVRVVIVDTEVSA